MEASSKHQPEAFKFLTWATSKGYIKLVAGAKGWGNVPPGTRYSTFSNPNYRKAVPYGNIILQSMNTANPNHATLHPVPYVGVQFVGIPEFQNIGTLVTQNLSGALTGRTLGPAGTGDLAVAGDAHHDAGRLHPLARARGGCKFPPS